MGAAAEGGLCLGVDPVVPKFVGINSHSILDGVGIVAAEAEQRCAPLKFPRLQRVMLLALFFGTVPS
jgi:hypothetical protein